MCHKIYIKAILCRKSCKCLFRKERKVYWANRVQLFTNLLDFKSFLEARFLNGNVNLIIIKSKSWWSCITCQYPQF